MTWEVGEAYFATAQDPLAKWLVGGATTVAHFAATSGLRGTRLVKDAR